MTKSKTISERTFKGTQSWNFEKIEAVGPHRFRTAIKHDNHTEQSYGRIQRWGGSKWELVHYIAGSELRLHAYAKDAAELLRVACAVVGA